MLHHWLAQSEYSAQFSSIITVRFTICSAIKPISGSVLRVDGDIITINVETETSPVGEWSEVECWSTAIARSAAQSLPGRPSDNISSESYPPPPPTPPAITIHTVSRADTSNTNKQLHIDTSTHSHRLLSYNENIYLRKLC